MSIETKCRHCKKPVVRCETLPSHIGCSSAYGWIHDNGGRHACFRTSGFSYAEPEPEEVPSSGCREPHPADHRCFDCATDEELAALMTGQVDHASNPQARRKACDGERKMHAERERQMTGKAAPMTAEQISDRADEIAPQTAAGLPAALEAIRKRAEDEVRYLGLAAGDEPSPADDALRLLAGYDALLKLHRPKPNYALAFSPSRGTPLCGHDPDADHDSHFEGDDGEWYCRDKVTGQTCRTCADEENADLWAEWPCATYDAIAAALTPEEDAREHTEQYRGGVVVRRTVIALRWVTVPQEAAEEGH